MAGGGNEASPGGGRVWLRRIEVAAALVLGGWASVVRILGAVTVPPARLFDSAEFVGDAAVRTKPWLAVTVLGALPDDRTRVVLAAVVGAVAVAGLLAVVWAGPAPRWLRWPAMAVVAVWSAAAYTRVWDTAILAESLGMSAVVGSIALLGRAAAGGSTRWAASAAAPAALAAAVAVGLRETLWPVGVAIVVVAAWRCRRTDRLARGLVAGAAVGLVAALVSAHHDGGAEYRSGRVVTTADGYRTANVIWRRLAVVDPGWVTAHGVEVPADYREPGDVPVYLHDRRQVADARRVGPGFVVRFMLAHPTYALTAPLADEGGVAFDPTVLGLYDREGRLPHGALERVLEWPGRGLGVGLLALTALGVVVARRRRGDGRDWGSGGAAWVSASAGLGAT